MPVWGIHLKITGTKRICLEAQCARDILHYCAPISFLSGVNPYATLLMTCQRGALRELTVVCHTGLLSQINPEKTTTLHL